MIRLLFVALFMIGALGCASTGASRNPAPDLADLISGARLDADLLHKLDRCASECAEEERPHSAALGKFVETTLALGATHPLTPESLAGVETQAYHLLTDARTACRYLVAAPMSRGHQAAGIFNFCSLVFPEYSSKEGRELKVAMLLSLDHAVAIGSAPAEADELQGLLLEESPDPDGEALQAYARCLKADPARTSCRENYRRAGEKFMRRVCKVPAGLFIGLLDGNSSDGSTQGVFAREILGVTETARLAAQVNDGSRGRNPTLLDTLQILLNATGTKKLARLTRSNVGGKIGIRIGSRLVSNAVILTELREGQFNISAFMKDGFSNPVFQVFCPRDPAIRLPDGLIPPG